MITRLAATAATVAALALGATGCETGTDPITVQGGDDKAAGAKGAKGKSKPVTVKLSAKKTTAKKSVLSDGGALSCVKVTVTNQRKGKNLSVNPLYFSITDTKGVKHEVSNSLGDYEGQMDTSTLAPGEKAVGTVCGEGKFTPKVVAMTNELLQEAARAQVA